MTEPMAGRGMTGFGRSSAPSRRTEPANLADILERVLDKGIVIAGDIQVNLLDIELLTIKLRLVIASVDRAKEMGIDWWEHDPTLSSAGRGEMADENRRLRERIAALEERADAVTGPDATAGMETEAEARTEARTEGRREAGAREVRDSSGRRTPRAVSRPDAAEWDLEAADRRADRRERAERGRADAAEAERDEAERDEAERDVADRRAERRERPVRSRMYDSEEDRRD